MNKIIQSRPSIKEILEVNSPEHFHSFLVNQSINSYIKNLKNKLDLSSVLALGANHVEAENFIKFPFKKIVLTGITPADERIKRVIKKDKRVSYKIENIEKLSFKSSKFDMVFVKEALHHVSRPILGLYEMLRVSKNVVIFIEPHETFLGNILEKLNLSSIYEKNYFNGKKLRDNYVYRWNKKEIIKIMNSYYLESGYKIIFSNCWMSNRYNMKHSSFLIKIFNLFGWFLSFLPKNKGNYLICTIFAGKDIPGYFIS